MLPPDYLALLEELAKAFAAYERETGGFAVLVGGAATAIQTAGEFMSGDFDIVAPDDDAFEHAMLSSGFLVDERIGRLKGGYFHPDLPRYGVEQVSGGLFEGRADRERLIRLTVRGGEAVNLPSVEDLIADRLAQHSVAGATDDSRLLQARMLLRMAKEVDSDYMLRRIAEEGGDASLLEVEQ